MDRFLWLDCQPWLLPSQVQSSFEAIEWVFQGFASFYISPPKTEHRHDTEVNEEHGEEEEEEEEEEGEGEEGEEEEGEGEGEEEEEEDHLSENASHLVFAAAPSSPLHPDEMVFKLGLTPEEPGKNCSNIVLSFDGSTAYSLDISQVLSISKWMKEGCKICRISNNGNTNLRMEKSCTCQLLPPCLVMRLKHLSMIMYSKEPQFNEIYFRTVDILIKVLKNENAPSLNHESRKNRGVMSIAGHSSEASALANASEALLQEFLVKLDGMIECASKAVEVCAADAIWMSNLLHAMAKQVIDGKNISLQIKAFQHQLESRLQSLEGDEHKHIATVWGPKATKNPEIHMVAVEALKVTLEQKEQIRAAILRIELLNASAEHLIHCS